MEGPVSQQTILIVDDVKGNINVLSELLRDEYKIKAATSGERALSIAFSDAPPDMILLDVVMPDMDGYEVCRRLKERESTRSIPVMFITGKGDVQDEVFGFTLGAVDYITKPFNPVVVKARVGTHAELKRHRDRLESLSYLDGLTGIANRRKFNESLEMLLNVARRESLPISVILIDIDLFKHFNDTYGHQAGDECLILVASTLSESLMRKSDLVARFGGEEFVCLLPGVGSDGAHVCAERLRQSIQDLRIPHSASSVSSFVTISLGVSTSSPELLLSAEDLVKSADDALYQSKHSGRNRVSRAF